MTSKPRKVVDLIKTKQFSYSFEVTPDVNLGDIDKLEVEPTYFSVTWHAKSHLCKNLGIAPLRLVKELKAKGKEVVLHLSCDLLKKDFLDGLLKMLQHEGIRNLFVVLGESYDESQSDFKSTQELIRYIRKNTLDYFCIGVAGFTSDSEEKLQRLKDKVQSGADFILTQAIFKANDYEKFINNCHKLDITIPIIPGFYVFETCEQLISFVNMCKVNADDLINEIKNYTSAEICIVLKKLADDVTKVKRNTNLHIFTLNRLGRASNFVRELN